MSSIIANTGGLIAIMAALFAFYGLLKTFIKDTIDTAIKGLKESLQEDQQQHLKELKNSIDNVGQVVNDHTQRIKALERIVFPPENTKEGDEYGRQ